MQAISLAHQGKSARRPPRPRAPNVGRVAGKLFDWRRAFLEFGPAAPVTRLVCLVIASYMGMDGGADGKTFPSYKTIANGACITPRAAMEHVGSLVESGWLNRHPRRGRSGVSYTSNRYVAAYPPHFDVSTLTDRDEPPF